MEPWLYLLPPQFYLPHYARGDITKPTHTPTTYTGSNQLKIALIQPAIPQLVIWDPTMTPMRQKQLMDLTIKAARNKPDLIIWPEASLPEFTEDFFSSADRLRAY